MLFCGRVAKKQEFKKEQKNTMKLYQRAVVYFFVAVDQAYW